MAMVTLPISKYRKKKYLPGIWKNWTAFTSEEAICSWIDEFLISEIESIEIRNSVYEFIKEFDGEKVLLTGCDQRLVEEFLKRKGYYDLFNSIIGSKVGKNGFKVVRHPYGKEKCNYLNETNYNVGIGNEYADVFYLLKCREAIAVNPDRQLRDAAINNSWRIL
jgi:phosphoserine phosphatase